MLTSKEEIKKKKKSIIKKALKYAKENNDDFIGFLTDVIDELRDNSKEVPKGLRRMIRELKKKPLLLTQASIKDKKWALEFYRDYEIYESNEDLLVINQMLVDERRIDPDYDGEVQDWQLLNIEQESKIEHVNAKEKMLDKTRVIDEK